MIERIFKNIKYIGLGFLVLDVLFIALTAVYYALILNGIIAVASWFVIICCMVIALNVLFAISLLVIKKLRKY